MKFADLIQLVGDEPLFETGFLLAGPVDAADLRRQLSRWVAAKKLFQLRRGLYALAPPYRKVDAHPFYVSNQLVHGSYVSLQSALAYYGWIPEAVPVTTSVSRGRSGRRSTALGHHLYRHLGPALLFGYRQQQVAAGQRALIASPEKALLDLVHLTPGGDDPAFLRGLRLQGLDSLDQSHLAALVERAGRPKLRRAAQAVLDLVKQEEQDYQLL